MLKVNKNVFKQVKNRPTATKAEKDLWKCKGKKHCWNHSPSLLECWSRGGWNTLPTISPGDPTITCRRDPRTHWNPTTWDRSALRKCPCGAKRGPTLFCLSVRVSQVVVFPINRIPWNIPPRNIPPLVPGDLKTRGEIFGFRNLRRIFFGEFDNFSSKCLVFSTHKHCFGKEKCVLTSANPQNFPPAAGCKVY